MIVTFQFGSDQVFLCWSYLPSFFAHQCVSRSCAPGPGEERLLLVSNVLAAFPRHPRSAHLHLPQSIHLVKKQKRGINLHELALICAVLHLSFDHRMVATLLFLSHICILHDRPFLMLSMLLRLNCWKRIRFSVSASSSFVSFSLPDVDAEKMCLEPESVSLMETLITSQHCQGDLQNGFSPPSRVEAHSDTANDQQTREGSEKATSRLVCPVGSHKAALLYPSSLSSRWLNFDVKSLYRPCRNVTD